MIPKVSILMVAYNQERFIAQAIQSVLDQITDFPFKLIIGEDCSQDRTYEICREFQRKHQDKIQLNHRSSNLGMIKNFLTTYNECNGRYIAVLEGDDYWNDPNKLQKQVDFLDTHEDYSLVFCSTQTVFENEQKKGPIIPPERRNKYTFEELLETNFIATCSVMYRNGLIGELPSWLFTLALLDWPLHILHAQKGHIGYLDQQMACYRIHPNSNFSSRKITKNYQDILKFYSVLNNYQKGKYSSFIWLFQHRLSGTISDLYYQENNKLLGIWYNFLKYCFLILLRIISPLISQYK